MIRSIRMGGGLALAAIWGASAFAQGAAPQPPSTAGSVAAPTTAGWSCRDGRCSYRKAQGGWSDCFTSWSPTHGGWLPTRYCR